MSYKLFLDDVRQPLDCLSYMRGRVPELAEFIYADEDWVVVKDYWEFILAIQERGLPSFISFDHDLASVHYQLPQSAEVWEDSYRDPEIEHTGYHCAVWLKKFCYQNKLKLPEYFIHSMNPVGAQRIKEVLESPFTSSTFAILSEFLGMNGGEANNQLDE